MRRFEELDKSELRDLLVRNWMTHDAMWFANTAQRIGIEQTNPINRAAVKAMAMVEVRRLTKLLGVGRIRNGDDLRAFILEAFEVLRGPFMQFRLSFPETDLMRWEISSCFAYEGVSKLGIVDQYECGIFDRLDGWLEALSIRYVAAPPVEGCLQRRDGRCAREYRFTFD